MDKRISILVVDDFASMRMQIRSLLAQMGFRSVLEARSGGEAMALLEHEAIDFIISDWAMAGCSGLDLLRYVKGHEKHRNLPFLMVTGFAEKENVIKAVEAGVSNYIIKPFTPETLETKIRAIFACSESLWEESGR